MKKLRSSLEMQYNIRKREYRTFWRKPEEVLWLPSEASKRLMKAKLAVAGG